MTQQPGRELAPAVQTTGSGNGQVQGRKDPAEICFRPCLDPQPLQPRTPSQPPRHFQTSPSRRLGRVASIGSLRPFDCRFFRSYPVSLTIPVVALDPKWYTRAVPESQLKCPFHRPLMLHCQPLYQEHSKVLILSDCGGIGQSTSASAGCWRIVICRCGCWSCVNRSSLRDGSALVQSVLVGCGRTWCVARCLAHGVLPAVWRDQRIGLVMLSRAS